MSAQFIIFINHDGTSLKMPIVDIETCTTSKYPCELLRRAGILYRRGDMAVKYSDEEWKEKTGSHKGNPTTLTYVEISETMFNYEVKREREDNLTRSVERLRGMGYLVTISAKE